MQTGSVDLTRAYEIASSSRVVTLALRTSVVVGSVLNLINQGDALLGDAKLSVFKLGLTYLVPYCVATYSATSVLLKSQSRDESADGTPEAQPGS